MLYYHKFALLSRGKRKILKNVFSLQNINPKDWPRGNKTQQKQLAVFDVGGIRPRLRVILREPEGRVEIFVARHRRTEKIKGCLHPEGISYEFDLPLQRQTYILCDKTVLYPQKGTSDSQ